MPTPRQKKISVLVLFNQGVSDTVAPTVEIALSDYAIITGDTPTVTFTFSEEPTGFTVANVTSPNGSLSAFGVTGDPLVYTAVFTPTVGVDDATNVITIDADWTDAAGNPPVGVTTSDNYTVNTVTPLQSILAKFEIEPRSVGYTKELSNLPAMLYDIGGGLCVCMKFDAAPVALSNVPKITTITARRLLIGVEEDAAGVVTTSGSWNGVAAGDGYGGDYNLTLGVGAYMQWTTPAGVTLVHGFGLQGADNTGVHLVTIDGDKTLANLLPTAQDLVTAGTIADTCLVANGGTLNPTDRCWDQYSTRANKYAGVTFSDNLSAGSHVVRVTCTGYKNGSSSAARLYASGFGYWMESVTLATTNAFVGHIYEAISSAGSIWEFAHNYEPTVGGTVDEWMGHSPSDKLDSWTVTVDDVAADPAAFAVAGGQEVKIVIASTLSHTEAASCASMVLTHTLTPDKLTVNPVLTWNTAGTVLTGYSHMLPMLEAFDRGSNVADTEDHVLTVGNGLLVSNFQSQAAYMWDADGLYGALLYIPDLAGVNNWDDCNTSFMAIEDRSGNLMNKIYLTRTDSNLVVAPNDVFDSTAEYRIKRFSGGANATLARA